MKIETKGTLIMLLGLVMTATSMIGAVYIGSVKNLGATITFIGIIVGVIIMAATVFYVTAMIEKYYKRQGENRLKTAYSQLREIEVVIDENEPAFILIQRTTLLEQEIFKIGVNNRRRIYDVYIGNTGQVSNIIVCAGQILK